MSSTSLNHYALMPMYVLDNSNLSSDAKVIFGKLVSFCNKKNREVFAYTKNMAEIMNCTARKVQRCYNELIQAGLIKFTGKKHLGIWRVFEIVDLKQNKSVTCDTPVAPPVTHDAQCEQEVPTEHRKTEDKLKNNNSEVVFEDIVESGSSLRRGAADEAIQENMHHLSNSNICELSMKHLRLDRRARKLARDDSVLEQLLIHKLSKDQATKLVSQYGEDECLKQIKHLELLQSQNVNIAKPNAWLVSAIQRRFALPPDNEIPKETNTNPESALKTKHLDLLDKAKMEIHFGDWSRAAAYAREALTYGDREVFHRIIEDAGGFM